MKVGGASAVVAGLEANVQAIEPSEVLKKKFAVPWGHTVTALPHHQVGLAVVVQDAVAKPIGDHLVRVRVGGETPIRPLYVRHDPPPEAGVCEARG